jgi:hypothetical protein
MRQQNSDTDGFIATMETRQFLYNYCVQELWRENKRKSQFANQTGVTVT